MQERGQEEGEEDTSVADDGACERDDKADAEQADGGKQKAEGVEGEAWVGARRAEVSN